MCPCVSHTIHPARPQHTTTATTGCVPSVSFPRASGPGQPPLSHTAHQGKLTSRFVLALRSTLWVLVTAGERDGVSEVPVLQNHLGHVGTRPAWLCHQTTYTG